MDYTAFPEPKKIEWSFVAPFLFGLASLFLVFFASLIVLVGVIFLRHGHLSLWPLILALVLTTAYAFFYVRTYFSRQFLVYSALLLLSFVAILAFSLQWAGHFYDVTYDGQAYHQEAIIQLKVGWNPIDRHLGAEQVSTLEPWVNYYAKGAWVTAASFYLLTNNLEQAKGLNLVFMLTAFALILSFFLESKWVRAGPAILLSGLIAFNPVSLYQLLSFYVDGQLASQLICLLAVLLTLYFKPKKLVLPLLFCAIILLINVKFTGGVYAGLLTAMLGLLLLGKRKFGLTALVGVVGGLAFGVGIFIAGFSPYVTNYQQKGNPFYPLYGQERNDLSYATLPANFMHKNSLELLFLSPFTRSNAVWGSKAKAQYKLPFTYDQPELDVFSGAAPAEGGFGPLFGGALLLTVALLISLGRHKRELKLALVLVAILILSCLPNSLSSVARYVPQFWLVPLAVIAVAWRSKQKIPLILASLTFAVLVINNLLILIPYLDYNIRASQATEYTLEALPKNQSPLVLYFDEYRSTRIKLNAVGVRFRSIEHIEDCQNPKRILIYNITLSCAS